MVWPMIAMAAIQVGSALLGSKAKREQARIANIKSEADAYAKNKGREGSNLLAGAEASLSRYAQSVNNQRLLDSAASNSAAGQRNLARSNDARSGGTFASRLGAAEELGAAAAAEAFNGVTGGVGTMVAGTLALRQALGEEAARRSGEQQSFEITEQSSAFMKNAILGQDSRFVADNIDYGTNFATVLDTKSRPLMDILGSGAVGTVLGGMKGVGSTESPVGGTAAHKAWSGVDYQQRGGN